MQSHDAAAYRAVPAECTMILAQANTSVHGLPVQSRDAAAYRAVPAARAMILAHMVMNGGKCKKGSRHGVMAKAGRQGRRIKQCTSTYTGLLNGLAPHTHTFTPKAKKAQATLTGKEADRAVDQMNVGPG